MHQEFLSRFLLPLFLYSPVRQGLVLGGFICRILPLHYSVFGEKKLHINILEMKAVHLAFNAFLTRLLGKFVVPMRDNATVVACLKKHGGTVSWDMCSLAQNIKLSELHMATIFARCFLGK